MSDRSGPSARAEPWRFDADGARFRLVAEAQRIRLAYLFDPLLAVHTSLVEPLPHQITAVYESMLPRQPLRFLLADDPGSGKTIMAGLLMRELIARGDLERCLVVCPGSLAEQWQDELAHRFHLPFTLYTTEAMRAARPDNWFRKHDLVIARLDMLSRNEEVKELLRAPGCEWDLVVCDEAHKMSATYAGAEVKYTKRYRLGQLLGGVTRHLLLMTATPHNGKEEDFQQFMALLDGDRFEGRFRPGVHSPDTSDLMRRMVKEKLLKFDGTPLFPVRRAHTVPYRLSPAEARLYGEVTEYVRKEFNRAERLGGKRRTTIGFALTLLQRRLASSPQAIYRSLHRRRQRLENRLTRAASDDSPSLFDAEQIEDLEDGPEAEFEAVEAEVLGQATAAQSRPELEAEIDTLRHLESLAKPLVDRWDDTKWTKLSGLLEELLTPAAFPTGVREPDVPYSAGDVPPPRASPSQKLVIFTEHRDTLEYLHERITTRLGRPEAVTVIHGGIDRRRRLEVQEAFRHDPEVRILVATDAAGEGINLQRAHLMVNYDLPWNPNRLEQRFGRIHRIGQTEACHLWNLLAEDTREGAVYQRLLEKVEVARRALGGQVFDVLGQLEFGGRSLRELLLEAVRYGDRPEVRNRLQTAAEGAVDEDRLHDLIHRQGLVHDTMDTRRLRAVREEMERAEARRLQPHFVESYFLAAFRRLGGIARQREQGRYEVSRVPGEVRRRAGELGTREPVAARYERITFDKSLVGPQAAPAAGTGGQPQAAFVCPGHPLLDAVIDLTLERDRGLLRRGAVLVDDRDDGVKPRLLVTVEHSVSDGRPARDGRGPAISRQIFYVELGPEGARGLLRSAPYLDFRPLTDGEPRPAEILRHPECGWVTQALEDEAEAYATAHVAPAHLEDVRKTRMALLDRTEAAIKARLTKEIAYWDHRAEELKLREEAGDANARLTAGDARRRADQLQARLTRRQEDLQLQRKITAGPPKVTGVMLVAPRGLLKQMAGQQPLTEEELADTQEIAARARAIVMEHERHMGHEAIRDRETEKVGYDIESRDPATGHLRFIEVKGRAEGADTITVTQNEIRTCLNSPDAYHLAIVIFLRAGGHRLHYVPTPFRRQGDFEVASSDYKLSPLLTRAVLPP